MELGDYRDVPATLPLEKKHSVPCTEWWIAPGSFWMDKENFGPTGNRHPDRPARSELL